MKKQACKKVAGALLPHLSGYRYESKPNAIFQTPIGNIFRGMIFSSSGFSSSTFYPHAFVQLLYVPVEYFTLSIGKRLNGSWEYEPGQEETLAKRLLESIEREGVFRLWDDLSTADKFARNLSKYHSNPNDPYFQQAIAYSFAVCGQFGDALNWLDKCRGTLKKMQESEPDIRWYAPLLDEVTKFRELVASNPSDSTAQLDEWTEYTRSKLKLPA
jgi:hypothetical protein